VKRVALLVLFAFVWFDHSSARANGLEFVLSSGAAVPVGFTLEYHPDVESKTGFAIGAEAIYFFSENVGLDLTLLLNRNDFRGPVNLLSYGVYSPRYDVGTQETLYLFPGFKARYPGNFSPFIKFATGIAFNSFDQNLTIDVSPVPWQPGDLIGGGWYPGEIRFRSTDSLSFLIGGGLDIRTSDSFSMGFSAQYHWNRAEFLTEAANGGPGGESESTLSVLVLQGSLGFQF